MNTLALYEQMGPAGVALAAVAVLAAYLCVKYVIYLTWIGWAFRSAMEKLDAASVSSTFTKSLESSGNPLIQIFCDAIRPVYRGANDLRAELAFLFHKHFRKVNRAMTLLRLVSVISPLLGLLGTVLGITKVFRVIGAQTAVNPAHLANGIWEALTTTIIGLAITVPVLCFTYLFRLQITGFQVELTEYAGRFAPAPPATER